MTTDSQIIGRWTALVLMVSALSFCGIARAEDEAAGTIVTDRRLPPRSVELHPGDDVSTETPWKLPQPGEPLYDAAKELEIRRQLGGEGGAPVMSVRIYDHGVFAGYGLIRAKKGEEKAAGSAVPPSREEQAQRLSGTVIAKVSFQNEPLPECLKELSRLASEAGGQGFSTTFKGEGWPRITFGAEKMTLGEILEKLAQRSKASIRLNESGCEVTRSE